MMNGNNRNTIGTRSKSHRDETSIDFAGRNLSELTVDQIPRLPFDAEVSPSLPMCAVAAWLYGHKGLPTVT